MYETTCVPLRRGAQAGIRPIHADGGSFVGDEWWLSQQSKCSISVPIRTKMAGLLLAIVQKVCAHHQTLLYCNHTACRSISGCCFPHPLLHTTLSPMTHAYHMRKSFRKFETPGRMIQNIITNKKREDSCQNPGGFLWPLALP